MTNASLQITTPSDLEIQMVRVFNAPKERVYRAFTDPDLVQRWLLGPEGWSFQTCEMDVRTGGSYHWVWVHQQNGTMGLIGSFREVSPPDRIVHTERYEPAWGDNETVVTTTFVEEAGRTVVTVISLFSDQAARDALLHSGMAEGVTRSYDLLEDLLATFS